MFEKQKLESATPLRIIHCVHSRSSEEVATWQHADQARPLQYTRFDTPHISPCIERTIMFAEAYRNLYLAAVAYQQAGLSFIPIAPDGTKSPLGALLPSSWCASEHREKRSWKIFTTRQASEREIYEWFNPTLKMTPPPGIGIIGGVVSRHLTVIDFDDVEYFQPWRNAVQSRRPGLLEKLVLVQSPRPGMHVYFRTPCSQKCRALASILIPHVDGVEKPKKIIEVKAEGGYVLAPPSLGNCHPTGREYTQYQGDLTHIQTLTQVESMILLDAATALGTYHAPTRPPILSTNSIYQSHNQHTNRPGDQFAARTSWHEILAPHGWIMEGPETQGLQRWRRPGKDSGCSATTGFAGRDILYMFSESSHPFEARRGYGKFRAFTLLNYKGNFQLALQAISSASRR